MYITVKDILELKEFEEVNLIAGHEGLYRRVKDVYFMEVPDIYSFIDKDGLLLTTLYPISNNEEAIKNFIPKLVDYQLAGVAIKPGRYIDTIPEIMIKQANNYKFPLIKLQEDANLSTLTIDILSSLLGIKTSILEFRDKIHKKLLNLLLQGVDLRNFLISIEKIIHTPILVLNHELKFIDSSLNVHEQDIKITYKNNYRNRYLLSPHDICIKIEDESYEYNDLFIQPIYAGNENFGYAVIIIPKGQSIHENLIVTVEQASILLAAIFQREKLLLEKERNYLVNFVQDMFNERYISQTEVIEKAKVFKWKILFPLTILNIKTNIKNSEKRFAFYYKMLNSGLIEKIVSETLDIPLDQCKVLYYSDSIICFISISSEKALKERLLKTGEKIILNFANKINLAITYSQTFNHISQAKSAFDNSLLTYNIYADNLDNESFVQFYDELGTIKLFHQIDRKHLEQFVSDKLGKILTIDKHKDSKLIETIRCLVKNNGNLQKTADEMYIHYNTLRYRVNKLKELGINIEDGNEMNELFLACKIHQYLNSII